MDIQEFTNIGIIGILASAIIEGVTRKFDTTPILSKLISIGFCVVVGTIYFFVRNTSWWASVVGVLASASTIYAIFFNKNG